MIRNYQRTPAVPEALKILEEAYRKLELTELADDVARVYDLNYANGLPAEAKTMRGQSTQPICTSRNDP